MKAVVFNSKGGPEVLEVVEQEKTEPKEGEALIKVTSAGLNRADLLFREGRYYRRPEFPSRIGAEGAGVVEAVGEGVAFKPGDRVGTLPSIFDFVKQGGVAEYMTVPARFLLPTPESVDDLDAGGIWMQYLTAWGALGHAITLKPGQWVVVTAGSSSVSLAAVQIAKFMGAQVIATTTSKEKIGRIKDNGADHVIDIKEGNYTDEVKEIAGGAGVDAVLDPVAGPAINDHIRICKPLGWIFVYGVLDLTPVTVNIGLMIGKNINLRGYSVGPIMMDEKGLANAVKQITDNLNDGTFKVIVARRFPMSETAEAHRYMASNHQIGKIVINP